MEIYLIRHTRPDIGQNICYGQTDIDVASSFIQEASQTKKLLPAGMQKIYSSPLLRCKKLAQFLFPGQEIEYLRGLKEIHFGSWELKDWNLEPPEALKDWWVPYINDNFPGGESITELAARSCNILSIIDYHSESPVAVVTHNGVIQCILSYITGTPLRLAIEHFKPRYGEVVRLTKNNTSYSFEFLKSEGNFLPDLGPPL